MPEDISNKNKEEIRFQNPWKVFLWEAVIFSLTLGLGILTALKLTGFFIPKVIFSQAPRPTSAGIITESFSLSSVSLAQFFGYFIFTLIFILFVVFVLKSKRTKKIIFRSLFVLATGFGSFFTLFVWYTSPIMLLVVIILVIIWFKTKLILVHNLLLILGIAGIGSAMGLRLYPWTAAVILAVFSIYDFIAVYATKHMVKMAKDMIEHQAILAVVIPQKTSDLKATLKEVRPGGKFMVLGGGDIALPLLFSVSVLSGGIADSLIVAAFSLIGLFASFWIFIKQKVKKPIPALPPIALFSIIGFLISLII